MNEKVDIRVHFGNLADLSVYVTGTAGGSERHQTSKVTDADKIFYYSFDNISGGLIADEWGSRNAVLSGGKISSGKFGSALEIEKNITGASVSNALVTEDAWTVSYWIYSKALSERSSVLMSSDGKYSFDAAISSSNLKTGVHVGTGSGDVLTFSIHFGRNIGYI